MSITLKIGKKDLPRVIVAALFCIAGIILSVLQGFYDSIFWYAGLFLLTIPTYTMNSRDSKLARIIPEIIYPLFTAYFTIFFIEYTQNAHDFLIDRSNYFVKIDNEGIVRINDPISQYFGSYNPNGTTRTFFVTKSPNYYTNQPGIPV